MKMQRLAMREYRKCPKCITHVVEEDAASAFEVAVMKSIIKLTKCEYAATK